MLGAIISSLSLWVFYFIMYSFIRASIILLFNFYQLNHLTQLFSNFMGTSSTKMILFCSLLSLGGLPPFLGFLPKWIVIQALISTSLIPLVMWVLTFTLVTLFFYTRLSYSAFMLTHTQPALSPFPKHPGY